MVEAFPFTTPPRYLLRDRDGIYGADFVRCVEGLGIGTKGHCPAIALAESDGRTLDWIHPARVPGPRHCAQPTSPPPESGSLFRLLSPRPSSQGTGSGLARLAPGRTTRPRQHRRIAAVGRTASPLHPPSCVKVLLPLKVVRRDLRSNAYSAPG